MINSIIATLALAFSVLAAASAPFALTVSPNANCRFEIRWNAGNQEVEWRCAGDCGGEFDVGQCSDYPVMYVGAVTTTCGCTGPEPWEDATYDCLGHGFEQQGNFVWVCEDLCDPSGDCIQRPGMGEQNGVNANWQSACSNCDGSW